MQNDQRDQHLQALVRYMQQDAKLAMDMWRDFGNAMMLYTDNQKVLMASLSQIFDHLGNEPQPIVASEPTPLPTMPYPAYQETQTQYAQPQSYPASSQQPPWPPQQQVPTATVQHRQAPPQMPPPAPQREWRLSDALRAATPKN